MAEPHNVALWGCNGHDIKCNNEHNSAAAAAAATLSDAEREARSDEPGPPP